MANPTDTPDDVVELSATDGVAFIEQASPLTRLHYFDGQFLRASSFTTEQDYHRHALQLANVAGGWGVVNGFGIALAGDQLAVTPGLAVTPNGQLVLAGMDMKAKLTDLLGSAKPPAPGGSAAFADCLEAKAPVTTATAGLQVYEITVGPVEGLCGNEAVFGKLCETACATDSRRPFWREGVVLRLRPVNVVLPDSSAVKASTVHQRNRIASGYFANEPGLPGSLLSAAGLASDVWCEPAQLYHRDEVVIGLLWREAGTVRIDAWSGRRERMDTQARGYWQGRMAMRPWNVFIAQILQFQCQLSGLFDANSPVIQPGDDCEKIRAALGEARREIEAMLERFGKSSKGLLLKAEGRNSFQDLKKASAEFSASFEDLNGLSSKLATLDAGSGAMPQQRMLLNAGFFELPPAGYLPVSLTSDVQEQCRRMFGEGCLLHFHAVHADEIAHLVEEAEHMKRISLTRGLDDPKQLEEVEIFVPEGQVNSAASAAPGTWWQMQLVPRALLGLSALRKSSAPEEAVPQAQVEVPNARKARAAAKTVARDLGQASERVSSIFDTPLDGLIRTEGREDGSFGFAFVVGGEVSVGGGRIDRKLGNQLGDATTVSARFIIYFSGDIATDPFGLSVGGSTDFKAEIATLAGTDGNESAIKGTLTVLTQQALPDGTQQRLVQLDVQFVEIPNDGSDPKPFITRTRLILQRDGDGRTGLFVIDDDKQDPRSSPLFFDWSDTPRTATLSVQISSPSNVIGKRFNQMRGALAEELPGAKAEVPAAEAFERRQLMRMSALPAMPEPSSALGAAALNALAAVADAANDAALLLRGRNRLFPVLSAPKTQTVKARLDWVMFRRARTHLCGPACTQAAPVAVESFQVWHLKLDGDSQLAVVKKAIDSGDAKALAEFDFKRVTLLHYRDESAFSDETPDQVLQRWTLANPAARVALGRVWEVAPTVGQGWQNHMRLRHMLEQIDSLTKAPPAGDGSVTVTAPPPGELGDKSVDGGMLVVTLGEPVKTHNHRVVMLPFGLYADLVPSFRQSAKEALADMERFLGDPAITSRDKNAHFAKLQLDATDASALQTAHQEMLTAMHNGINVVVHQFLVNLKPIDEGVQPEPEQEFIAKLLKLDTSPASNGPNDGGTVTSEVTDLGRSSQVLTLLGYEDRS